jgi:hypothetical protein
MEIIGNLKSIRIKAGAVVLASALIAAAIGGITSSAVAEEERSGVSAPIEGSWIFSVTRVNDLSASFTAVGSFTAGGVFLATGSNDRVNPVSPLYGSWKRSERNLYISTTNFFGFDPATNKSVVMLKAFQTFKLTNHDELVGVGEAWACDLQGQNCQRAPIADLTVKGTRIIPQNVTELMFPLE